MVNRTEDYYECSRCKINSLTKDRMIPCPRGGCEADKKGILTFYLDLKLGKSLNKTKEKEVKDYLNNVQLLNDKYYSK